MLPRSHPHGNSFVRHTATIIDVVSPRWRGRLSSYLECSYHAKFRPCPPLLGVALKRRKNGDAAARVERRKSIHRLALIVPYPRWYPPAAMTLSPSPESSPSAGIVKKKSSWELNGFETHQLLVIVHVTAADYCCPMTWFTWPLNVESSQIWFGSTVFSNQPNLTWSTSWLFCLKMRAYLGLLKNVILFDLQLYWIVFDQENNKYHVYCLVVEQHKKFVASYFASLTPVLHYFHDKGTLG